MCTSESMRRWIHSSQKDTLILNRTPTSNRRRFHLLNWQVDLLAYASIFHPGDKSANNNGLGFRHGHDHVLMDFPLHEPEDWLIRCHAWETTIYMGLTGKMHQSLKSLCSTWQQLFMESEAQYIITNLFNFRFGKHKQACIFWKRQ